jgi:hypothetical protein
MAEIYAPQRGGAMGGVPERTERQTRPAQKTSKAAVVTTVIAVAAIVVLLLALIL